ncbi:LmeA family phospholipid-binding protein [Nocardia sp. CA-151230]|uniref:LmeA family phospholipid-binding protein n=1 Tax=Nocardia sp. CA-151230 TaxID=3239982 RepID=UPI003D8DCE5E
MNSEPTSDDAIRRDATVAQPDNPAAQPVEFGKPDNTPTEVLGAEHDSPTEVLNGQGATTDWWNDPTARHGGQATPDLGAQPTQALHPGEAAYAPGATAGPGHSTGTAPTAVLPAGIDISGSIPQPGGAQLPPGTPPPPMNGGGGQGGSSGKPRNRKRTLLIVGLVSTLLVAGGLAGGEAYARNKVEKCISSQFQAQMGSKIDVSFGWKPLLLTMFDHKVGSVTVNSDDSKFGPAQGMVVHATFKNLDMSDDGKQATVDSSTADVTWSTDGITKTLGGLVSGTTADPGSGTLSFAVMGGLAQLQVKPKIVGDKIEVDTLQASLLGFGLPTDLVSGIVDLMTQSLQSYPLGLQPTKVEVTKDGLHVALQGGHTELKADPDQQQPIDC